MWRVMASSGHQQLLAESEDSFISYLLWTMRYRSKPLKIALISFLANMIIFFKKAFPTYIWNEANFIEMVAQLWVMECNHLGKHRQVLWNSKTWKEKKMFVCFQKTLNLAAGIRNKNWVLDFPFQMAWRRKKNLKTLLRLVVLPMLSLFIFFLFLQNWQKHNSCRREWILSSIAVFRQTYSK